MLLQQERIESLKAGSFAGAIATLFFLLCMVIHVAIATQTPHSLVPLPVTLTDRGGLVSLLSAGITGFLFGTTYRYIIRQDVNPHLKSGAVLAFGLTRALAQMDIGLTLEATPWTVVLLAAESLLMVGSDRLVLDWALAHGWLKPFGQKDEA